jgi:DNA-directed RNA polymerase subunit RPC12/RpoP
MVIVFPIYDSHESAAQQPCIICGHNMEDEKFKYYDDSTGKYQLQCPECGASLFYDLEKEN